jgi:hypothetical protein
MKVRATQQKQNKRNKSNNNASKSNATKTRERAALKGWFKVRITALGGWGKPVPCSHARTTQRKQQKQKQCNKGKNNATKAKHLYASRTCWSLEMGMDATRARPPSAATMVAAAP